MTKTTETVIAYKGFDKNLQCRGYQYKIGETFTHDGPVKQCESGFHACQNPLDVLDHYGLGDGNRFARVILGGKIDRSDDRKWASAEITITAELKLPDLIADAIKFVRDACGKGAEGVQAASGDYSKLAASGYYSQLAASGYSSKLAASGYSSQLAASGDYSQLAASGYSSKLAASGYSSQLAASGDYSQLAASGYSSKLAASGYSSQLAASGDYSKLAASGDSSKLEISGAKSAAAAVGYNSRVKAAAGCPVAICEYDADYNPISFATGIAGQDGVPADTWLIAVSGKLVAA
ncbi:MAG: hypothetical protein KG075_17195 [Alphaproteobacteria bacterium]|nr:hypothetical protein [Alphaproteobacteria bacterium]